MPQRERGGVFAQTCLFLHSLVGWTLLCALHSMRARAHTVACTHCSVHALIRACTAQCTHCSVRARALLLLLPRQLLSQPISAFLPAAKQLHSANFCPFCQEHSCSQPSSALLPSTCTQPTSALSAMSAAATASLHLPILPCCHRPKTILAFLVASGL